MSVCRLGTGLAVGHSAIVGRSSVQTAAQVGASMSFILLYVRRAWKPSEHLYKIVMNPFLFHHSDNELLMIPRGLSSRSHRIMIDQ